MASNFDKTNTGTLQRNKDKDDSPEKAKWADFKGKININGVDHYLDAWMREGRYGKFMSLKIGPPATHTGGTRTSAPRSQTGADKEATFRAGNDYVIAWDGQNPGTRQQIKRVTAEGLGWQIIEATADGKDYDDDIPF